MVDVPNNIEQNLISDTEIQTTENTKTNIEENILQENFENNNKENISQENFENTETINCLALTIQKDYNLSIVKNVVLKTLKTTWKVAVSIFTLNFLKLFL